MQCTARSEIVQSSGLLPGIGRPACDNAKVPYEECKKLEADGKLGDAVAACYRANKADPNSDTGKLALTAAIRLEAQLNEIVPPTVTLEWCGRLRRRLQTRLIANAVAKYGGAGGDVGNVITDNVLNVENNCREDVGKATAGLWLCRWNETLDTASQCDGMVAR